MNDSSLFLGIDGGQSGTRCLVINGSGDVVGQGEAGKIDFVLAPGGQEKLKATLSSALQIALPDQEWKFRSTFAGLSGVVRGGILEEAVRSVCAQVFETEQLEIDNDAFIAWAGALTLQPGIVVIAGSGSVSLGVNDQGEVARAGGWGYLFGDEGGGFGIARDGLKMVLTSIDDNKPLVPLIELYTDFFGIEPGQVAKDFYAQKFGRDSFARITPKIADLALQGDAASTKLFADAAKSLASKVDAVAQKLSWGKSEIRWSPVGGVFRAQNLILDPMIECLKQSTSYQFKLSLPKFPPAVGAALLALSQINGPPEPVTVGKIEDQLF